MEFDGVYQIMVFFVLFCKLKVPKMWENSPVLQFSAFCILVPTFEVKGQYSWFIMLSLRLW
jgi:hypothetical protein